MTVFLLALPVAFAGGTEDENEALKQRIEDLEGELELTRQKLAESESLALAKQTEEPKKSPIRIGGAMRANHAYGDYDGRRGENIGDSDFELLRLNVDLDYNGVIGRAEYRETQLQQLRRGSGIDPPPCWMDGEGNPEYIFRIEVSDRGMRLFRALPADRLGSDPEAAGLADRIEEGRVYAPTEFLRVTRPFYALGTSRTEAFGSMGCRFWIRPVDRTGNRKDVFQERQRQLWRRFWFRW